MYDDATFQLTSMIISVRNGHFWEIRISHNVNNIQVIFTQKSAL